MKAATSKCRHSSYDLALAPYSVWALLFILVPLVFVAYYAFTDNNFNFTLSNITPLLHRHQ